MKYLILGFFLLACSSREPEEEPIIYSEESAEVNTTNPKSPSIIAKQLAAEQGSHFVTELNFDKGSTKLNQDQRKELTELYKEASQNQNLETIQILSWPDNKKSVGQTELADKRAKIVKRYLKGLDKEISFKEINMAKKEDEAELKKSLKIQGAYKDKTSLVMVIFVPERH